LVSMEREVRTGNHRTSEANKGPQTGKTGGGKLDTLKLGNEKRVR